MLVQYMFTNDKLQSCNQNIVNEKTKETKKTKEIKKYEKPKYDKKDSLFWCYNDFVNGDKFVMNESQLEERRMKIALVERLRTHNPSRKFAAVSHIENKLANDATIDLPTFLTLCDLDELNIVVVNNRTYYEMHLNDDRPTYCVYKKDYKYEIQLEPKLDEIRSSLFRVLDLDKPLKSISAYKLDELIDMHHRISGGDASVKQRKADLYQALVGLVEKKN
jgi:hypothetical protein